MDIVERLKNIQYDEPLYIIMEEAADEIERLREALLKIKRQSNEGFVREIAHSALQQKDSE